VLLSRLAGGLLRSRVEAGGVDAATVAEAVAARGIPVAEGAGAAGETTTRGAAATALAAAAAAPSPARKQVKQGKRPPAPAAQIALEFTPAQPGKEEEP
jgi:hypothetical protein